MKKSDKSKIDPEDLIKDMDMIVSYLNKVDGMNLMAVDPLKIKKQALAIEKKIKDKYKGLYNEKDIENDLDIKK